MTTLPPLDLGNPAQLDITAYRGDTGTFRVLVTRDGAPLDVSTATWDCDVRGTPDGALLATMTVAPVAGTTNGVDVTLPPDQSSLVTGPAGPGAITEAVWDLEMTLGTEVTTVLRGQLVVTPDVSRATIGPPDTGGGPPAALAATEAPTTAPTGSAAALPPLVPGTVPERADGSTPPTEVPPEMIPA